MKRLIFNLIICYNIILLPGCYMTRNNDMFSLNKTIKEQIINGNIKQKYILFGIEDDYPFDGTMDSYEIYSSYPRLNYQNKTVTRLGLIQRAPKAKWWLIKYKGEYRLYQSKLSNEKSKRIRRYADYSEVVESDHVSIMDGQAELNIPHGLRFYGKKYKNIKNAEYVNLDKMNESFSQLDIFICDNGKQAFPIVLWEGPLLEWVVGYEKIDMDGAKLKTRIHARTYYFHRLIRIREKVVIGKADDMNDILKIASEYNGSKKQDKSSE